MSSSESVDTKSGSQAERTPRHVAIILDGNGRWAEQRNLSRSEGHRAGAKALDALLDYFLTLEIPFVSLYAFSTENWKRPETEVSSIWEILNNYFKKRLDYCREKGIRLMVSGDTSRLPLLSRQALDVAIRLTGKGDAFTANFCINYGSQDEILRAATAVVQERLELSRAGDAKLADSPVSLEELERHLYTHPLPPVDLLIRPGGEHRISNFLLWQSAYAEIYFTDTLWPDFDSQALDKALEWYARRDRRFGGLSEQGGNS